MFRTKVLWHRLMDNRASDFRKDGIVIYQENHFVLTSLSAITAICVSK